MVPNPAASLDESDPESGRRDMLVAAALLDAGRTAVLAGHFAAVVAVVTLLLARDALPVWAFASLLIVVGLWPTQCWYAVRVALDASLFRALGSDSASLDALDASLARWRLRKVHGPRTAEERIVAAVRLWRRHLGIVGLQIAGSLLSLVGVVCP